MTRALDALLAYIGEVRDRSIVEVRGRADREVREVLTAARRKARERIVRALKEERHDADLEIQAAQAASQARLRHARHQLITESLARVWARIERGLRERWREPAARRAWVGMALADAARHLPDGAWRIEAPAGWDPAESGEDTRRVRELRPGVAVEFAIAPDLDAGVRISCGPARLDASAAGLLRAREDVEGAWLALLAQPPAAPRAARTGT